MISAKRFVEKFDMLTHAEYEIIDKETGKVYGTFSVGRNRSLVSVDGYGQKVPAAKQVLHEILSRPKKLTVRWISALRARKAIFAD